MTQAEVYMMQALVVFLFAFIVIIYLFRMKRKFQKQAIDHVQCRMITEEGTAYSVLKKVENGMIDFDPDKAHKKGRSYPVKDIATHLVDYPEGWIPGFLKTKVKEAIFWEWSWEPISNRSNELLLPPGELYNIKNERFTDVGVAHARDEAELQEKISQKPSFTGLYLLAGIACLATLVVGIYLYMNLPAIKEILEKVSQALGV